MPRTIFDKPKHSKLYILVNGAVAGVSRSELCEIFGKSEPTVKKMVSEPENMTLNDLKKLCRKQQISLEEFRQAITF